MTSFRREPLRSRSQAEAGIFLLHFSLGRQKEKGHQNVKVNSRYDNKEKHPFRKVIQTFGKSVFEI